jgi:hypothetical protein
MTPRRIVAVPLALALFASACTAGRAPSASPPPSESPAPPSVGATPPAVAPTAIPNPTIATEAPVVPPGATLSAGEVRQPAELGSWTWQGRSDSAPWLPASALDVVAVPAAAELRVAVDDAEPLAGWTARAAPASDPSGTEITPLGTGSGEPAFAPPAAGAWVIQVQARFVAGGDAAWYWSVDVR